MIPRASVRCCMLALIATLALAGDAAAQGLAEFEGRYQYRDGDEIILATDGAHLVAILDDAKYPLRRIAGDRFLNGPGDTIPFLRDSTGRVAAFLERGDRFPRLSTAIGAEARALLVPRANRADGRPEGYRCTAPPALNDGIEVGAPGEGSVSCDVGERLVAGILDGTWPDVRAIAIYHRDMLVLEEYFYGYDRDRPHQMRSLTKSVITLLAGAAVDRGLLRADEAVLTRLGIDSTANPDPRKARITLAHLLSNQSGLACDDHDGASPGNESALYGSPDWIQAFADLPMLAEPGTVGRYCSFGFIAAGRMIELATGKALPEFADEALFTPLGTSPEQWRWTFLTAPSTVDLLGQIHLRPRDMLKLGMLLQKRGRWQGKLVIAESWTEAMMAKQSRVDDSDYGFGVWHRWYGVSTGSGTRRVDTIMLSGNGGQKVYLVPELELIAVFTGGVFNVESPANAIMARVVLPALMR